MRNAIVFMLLLLFTSVLNVNAGERHSRTLFDEYLTVLMSLEIVPEIKDSVAVDSWVTACKIEVPKGYPDRVEAAVQYLVKMRSKSGKKDAVKLLSDEEFKSFSYGILSAYALGYQNALEKNLPELDSDQCEIVRDSFKKWEEIKH